LLTALKTPILIGIRVITLEAHAVDLINRAIETHGDRFAIVTGFQLEGMVLVDIAARIGKTVRVLSLNTGRLPRETFTIAQLIKSRYGIEVEFIEPAVEEVDAMVERYGVDLFYSSVAHRMLCCQVRKVRPLERWLQPLAAYAVGLRRGQTEARGDIGHVTKEPGGRLKLAPLADWTREMVVDYTARHHVPQHPLYARGYASIGCGPCTRAIQPGEAERAGRWWWEDGAQKECGLHFSPDGKAERQVDVLLREVLADAHA